MNDTPRTDAVTAGCHFGPFVESLAALSRQLERELAEANKKLTYVHSMGLRFGMMKSSDRPEPYLMHTWTDDSDHERMFREWSNSIGWEDRVAATKAERDLLERALRLACEQLDNPAQSAESWMTFLIEKARKQ